IDLATLGASQKPERMIMPIPVLKRVSNPSLLLKRSAAEVGGKILARARLPGHIHAQRRKQPHLPPGLEMSLREPQTEASGHGEVLTIAQDVVTDNWRLGSCKEYNRFARPLQI
ncbi:unnamed protein product, partial [Ectocarpus fasciculatus]